MPETKRLRVVVDTNNLVKSVLTKESSSNNRRLVEIWKAGKFQIIASEKTLRELEIVLDYPRVKKRLGESEEGKELLDLLRGNAVIVGGQAKVSADLGDPKDEMFLACALEGKADYVISADNHLLDLGECEGIPIISVGRFVEILKGQS